MPTHCTTTISPTTVAPTTTAAPTTIAPTTAAPTTAAPTTTMFPGLTDDEIRQIINYWIRVIRGFC